MKVGELVTSLGGVGILLKLVSDDPIVRERYWLVQWTNGTRSTIRERFLEVINADKSLTQY